MPQVTIILLLSAFVFGVAALIFYGRGQTLLATALLAVALIDASIA